MILHPEYIKSPISNDPLNHAAGEQALRAGAKVEEKAKKWTEKYAME